MIISKGYAQKLINSGRATERGTCTHGGSTYYIIDRIDIDRVDHVRYMRLGENWHLPPLTKRGRSYPSDNQ